MQAPGARAPGLGQRMVGSLVGSLLLLSAGSALAAPLPLNPSIGLERAEEGSWLATPPGDGWVQVASSRSKLQGDPSWPASPEELAPRVLSLDRPPGSWTFEDAFLGVDFGLQEAPRTKPLNPFLGWGVFMACLLGLGVVQLPFLRVTLFLTTDPGKRQLKEMRRHHSRGRASARRAP